MLIMWRRAGESFIAGDAEIQVLGARGDRVKLGITAPESCLIVRRETRITQQQNISAALSADTSAIETLLRRFPGNGVSGPEN
jgi:carbon storage regulator CsrA